MGKIVFKYLCLRSYIFVLLIGDRARSSLALLPRTCNQRQRIVSPSTKMLMHIANAGSNMAWAFTWSLVVSMWGNLAKPVQIELANKTRPLNTFEDLSYKNARAKRFLIYNDAITGSTPSITHDKT